MKYPSLRIGAGLALAWFVQASIAAADVPQWTATATFAAPEAHQAAAADEQHFYAISSTHVAKYDRKTGERLALSTGAAQHLNSGYLFDGKLYCAHSNYPRQPEHSEIKLLDLAAMQLDTFHDFGNYGGSLTWCIRREGRWWCNFARYGENNSDTFLVEFDDGWTERSRWTYPPELIRQLGRNSLSGGIWKQNQLLVTGHDDPVLFRLQLPERGSVLTYLGSERVPFTGQGIAFDAFTGGLVGIHRAKRQVVFAERESNPLRLSLPPMGYSVTGAETSVYFDNLVLTESPQDYRFEVKCAIGRSEANRWTVTPAENDAGVHSWEVNVFRGNDRVATAAMTWSVTRTDAAAGRDVALLLVGDSLTNATVYANDLAGRLSAAGQPKWSMLGTHRPSSAAANVAHEGYGGWTWERFLKHYEPMPDPAQRRFSSPFVFLVSDQPRLDVGRYIREKCGGRSPDVVFFVLGINDCFAANPNDPAALDRHIDRVFGNAEALLTAFRNAAPQADLAVCLTTPPNARESGFEANYKGKYTRWGWKRIQHRLVERQLEQFGNRERDQVFVVPTELNLDPVDGYPVENGVHPNAIGYRQMAATLHAWLIARLADR